jgi:phospholipid/cholesterol/gamma-HCH transport system substrate-binding protein
MNKKSRTTTVEVLVGLLVCCTFVLLGVFTIVLSGDSIFAKKYPMSVRFNTVSGLREGDNVLVRGVKVGVVKSLEVLDSGVLLNFSTEQGLKIREDYRVSIQSSSALGGKYLNVYEGSAQRPVIREGTTLRGDDPVVLMDDAAELLHELRVTLKEGRVLENMQLMMKNLAEVSDRLVEGEGTIAKLINDDDIYQDIKGATAELKLFSEKLSKGDGTIAKLVNDGEIYNRVNQILEDIGTVSGRLANGEGTLGKLSADDELYTEVKKLVSELRAGIDDMREASPVTTFSSVVTGAF